MTSLLTPEHLVAPAFAVLLHEKGDSHFAFLHFAFLTLQSILLLPLILLLLLLAQKTLGYPVRRCNTQEQNIL